MKGFDVGTAAFVMGIASLAIGVYAVLLGEYDQERIDRIERTLRSYCSGEPRLQTCAKLDLPLPSEKR